jgi:2C-methyl-D-erythritol 2,4-cyclodiphosphate synthase
MKLLKGKSKAVKNIVGVTFEKGKFTIVHKDLKKEVFYEDNLEETFKETLKSNKLNNKKFVIALPPEMVKLNAFIIKDDMTKMKNYMKFLTNELAEENNISLEKVQISVKTYTDMFLPGKMIVSYAYSDKNKLCELLDDLGEIDILAIDVFSEGFNGFVNYQGDYIIINPIIEKNLNKVELYIYRDGFILANRTIIINAEDNEEMLKEEISRMTEFLRETITDFEIERYFLFRNNTEIEEALIKAFKNVAIDVYDVETSKFAHSIGLSMGRG